MIPIMPKGSMYMAIKIELEKFDGINSSMEFMRLLADEQNVFTFPSECFYQAGFLRIVITVPQELLIEACERISEFCQKHRKSSL